MRFEVHKSVASTEADVTRPNTITASSTKKLELNGGLYPPGLSENIDGSATTSATFSRGNLNDLGGSTDGERRFSESNVIDEEVEKYETSHLLDVDNNTTQRSLLASNARSIKSGAAAPYAHIGRLYAKRQTWRLVYKDGSCNVSSKNVSKRRKRYLVDLFTTFVDMKWRYNLVMFGVAFISTWFLFGFLWWGQAVIHGDHRHHNDSDWVSCVEGVFDFTTALLYSIETQQTIGYGTRAIDTRCPPATIILMIQSCVGVFIQSLMTGLIFAKLSRPKGRAQTLMFSRKAVICQRDGEYCLLFRLGDMRKSHIIGTSIRALIVKNRITREGEMIPLCQYTLKLETETNFSDGFVFLVWPVTIVHRIDESSPLWEMSAESLLSEHFEIIVILEGNLESTGNSAQFRTSYLPTEILWGQRLSPLFTYQKGNGQYEIDFTQFHNVVPVDSMPSYSAKEYNEMRRRDGTLNEDREKYFPANFTIQASDSRTASRYQSMIRRKLSRAKRPSLISSTPANGRRSVDNGIQCTPTEPTPKRSKHLSDEKSGSQSPESFLRRPFQSETGSDAGVSIVSSVNNSQSTADVESVQQSDNSGTRKIQRDGVNLYQNVPFLATKT